MRGPDAITWIATALALVASLVVGSMQGFRFVLSGYVLQGTMFLVVAPLALAFYGTISQRASFLTVPCHAFAQIAAFNAAALMLQFPLASMNLATIDASLVAIDRALGADWKDHFRWALSHPEMFEFLYTVYRSLLFQIPIVCAIVGFASPERLKIFVLGNTLALSAILAISAALPAGGAHFYFFSPPYPAIMATQFVDVRSGALRTLDAEIITGIITFPSYHAALAALIGMSFAGMPRLFVPVLIYEAIIIFSTRAIGGHYYADIIAGLVVAFIANRVATSIFTTKLRSQIPLYQGGDA